MLLGDTNNFDNEKYLNKVVYVISYECNNVEQYFTVYSDYKEARILCDMLTMNNSDEKWSYTLSKCRVKYDELETIWNY